MGRRGAAMRVWGCLLMAGLVVAAEGEKPAIGEADFHLANPAQSGPDPSQPTRAAGENVTRLWPESAT